MSKNLKQLTSAKYPRNGFTLVEMMVSISLFTVVLLIASSAFLSVVNADRKARATRIAMDNLNLTLEDMSRRIKTGTGYSCGAVSDVADCSMGKESISFYGQDGVLVTYKKDGTGITRQIGGTLSPLLVTAPEIKIIDLKFVVGGSTKVTSTGGIDGTQPYVVILVDGSTNAGVITSNFKIQTMVTQRAYDL